jgi:glutathione synthase/RimK-type ligase-like ATP-grasp enzyme
MTTPVLIVAHEMDLHAAAVSSHLRAHFGIDPLRIDLAEFPTTTARFVETGDVRSLHWDVTDLESVRAVWWRRPARSTVARSVDPDVDRFRQAECDHFAEGLLWSLDAVFVNDPGAQHRSARKLVQLGAARAVGLPVPDTVVTNDPAVAADFLTGLRGRAIYKRTGTGGAFSETRLVSADDLPRLSGITDSPTTFQEFIEGVCDVRIVWVAGQAWAVRIDSQTGAGWVDSRMDNSVAFTPYDLDENVAASLHRLMESLGLVFGVIDMRVSAADGQIYFLEVNPQGQFAYLEIKTGLPITRSVAALLAEPSRVRGRGTAAAAPSRR